MTIQKIKHQPLECFKKTSKCVCSCAGISSKLSGLDWTKTALAQGSLLAVFDLHKSIIWDKTHKL